MSEKKLYKVDLGTVVIDYDRQMDVLYVNFGGGGPDEEASESLLIGDNIVVRIKDGEVLGLTIMDFARNLGLD